MSIKRWRYDGDMNGFFRHDNQGKPPSLSDMGDLRQGTKSDLMGCLESLITVPQKDMSEIEAKNCKWVCGCECA